MASPTILSTLPPKAVMSAARRSKQLSTRFLTCSGSMASLSVVKPTRSANTTETTLRSSPRVPTVTMDCPHPGQKRARSGSEFPQDGHVIASQDNAIGVLGPHRTGPSNPPSQGRGSPPAHRFVPGAELPALR